MQHRQQPLLAKPQAAEQAADDTPHTAQRTGQTPGAALQNGVAGLFEVRAFGMQIQQALANLLAERLFCRRAVKRAIGFFLQHAMCIGEFQFGGLQRAREDASFGVCCLQGSLIALAFLQCGLLRFAQFPIQAKAPGSALFQIDMLGFDLCLQRAELALQSAAQAGFLLALQNTRRRSLGLPRLHSLG